MGQVGLSPPCIFFMQGLQTQWPQGSSRGLSANSIHTGHSKSGVSAAAAAAIAICLLWIDLNACKICKEMDRQLHETIIFLKQT